MPTAADRKEAEEELPDVLSMLAQNAPDAMMRMILRKPYVSKIHFVKKSVVTFSL